MKKKTALNRSAPILQPKSKFLFDMIVLMCCCTPTTNFSTAVFKVPITFEIKKALVWVKKRLHNRLWDKLKTVQHNMTTLQCRAGFFFFFRVVKTQTLLETQQLNKSKDLCKGGQEGPLLPRSSESKVEPQRRRRKKNLGEQHSRKLYVSALARTLKEKVPKEIWGQFIYGCWTENPPKCPTDQNFSPYIQLPTKILSNDQLKIWIVVHSFAWDDFHKTIPGDCWVR